MDPEKYRNLFIEEATEYLADISRALVTLEKQPRDSEALDLVFRLVHSIKGMAASLHYEGLATLAHGLEDRLGEHRLEGGVSDPAGLALLFRGLEQIEDMVDTVRQGDHPSPPDAELITALRGEAPRGAHPGIAAEPKKKARTRPGRPRARRSEAAPSPTWPARCECAMRPSTASSPRSAR